MMMPANYSVIAENEMTYVNGGASFIDAIGAVTAPIWGIENVKQFKVVDQTIGVLFSGETTWKAVGAIPKTLFSTNVRCNDIEKNNVGDYVMNALGIAAAVYNLGVAPTKNSVKEKELTFSKTVKATV